MYLALNSTEVPDKQTNMDASHQLKSSFSVITPIFYEYGVVLSMHSTENNRTKYIFIVQCGNVSLFHQTQETT